ncbi:hypothetical protein GA0070613_6378 [Micromonospora inositola]|uniref:Uncharacterized protein n=1 Tax=Micromonospora inositola TaxID=47865 RepID=A0A1C5K5X4_9ACTN|nr:hypothetical protein GA0070613_6378 [Micromonospora inositola]
MNLPLIGWAISLTVCRRDKEVGRVRELHIPLSATSEWRCALLSAVQDARSTQKASYRA